MSFREELVYRLMTPQGWRMSLASNFLLYNDDDERDGFFHLSAPHQVLGTAAKHYAEHDHLFAVGFAPDDLGDRLVWEASRGGEAFPHFYGFARVEAASHLLSVSRSVDGLYTVEEGAIQ